MFDCLPNSRAMSIVSVLRQDKGNTVKYTPSPEGAQTENLQKKIMLHDENVVYLMHYLLI